MTRMTDYEKEGEIIAMAVKVGSLYYLKLQTDNKVNMI